MNQNEATLSRFNGFYFHQPETIRPQLVNACTARLVQDGFDPSILRDEWLDQAERFYMECRRACMDTEDAIGVSNACLNIRGFVRAITLVAESDGYASLKHWIEDSVVVNCPEDEWQTLNNILDTVVTM